MLRVILVVVLLAVILGIAAWFLTRRSTARSTPDTDDEPLRSVVLLLREPIFLDAAILKGIAQRAWVDDSDSGLDIEITSLGSIPDPDGRPDAGVDGQRDEHFVILFRDFVFTVHVVPWPYVSNKEEAATMPDMRKRLLFLQHEAWVSCDLMTIVGENDDTSKEREAYRYMGRFIAELIDDRALLIYLPAYGVLHAVGEDTAAALRGTDPIETLKATDLLPMVSVDADDEEMRAAEAEARRRFSDFVRAFEAQAGSCFSVKAPVRYEDKVEYIWIEVDAIEGGFIYGRLGNDPHDLGPMKIGDRVRVAVDELNDWCYFDENDELVGGFTIPILAKRFKQQQEGR